MNSPFFSIIIPTYNRGHLIRATLNSLLDQSFGEFEVIVIDDGSTDNTEEVVKAFSNDKIRYFKVENGERGRARNIGVSYAKGQYVTFLDSDDLAYENLLSEASLLIKEKENPEIISLGYEVKRASGKVLKQVQHPVATLNKILLSGNVMSCIGVFLKKEVALQFPFEESRDMAGSEDWLLWLQLAARFKIWHSPEISAALIEHSERSVLHFSEEENLKRTQILTERLFEDAAFIKSFGRKTVQRIEGHMYTYTALHAAVAKRRFSALKYAVKGWCLAPNEIFRRRSLAIIKHCIR